MARTDGVRIKIVPLHRTRIVQDRGSDSIFGVRGPWLFHVHSSGHCLQVPDCWLNTGKERNGDTVSRKRKERKKENE